jgi:hypothetical protein
MKKNSNFIVETCVLLLLISGIQAGCDINSGPEGAIDCRAFSVLGTDPSPQWARCISRDRLKNITNNQLTCIFNFCNYLCMQEYYDISYGEIYSDCRCRTQDLSLVDLNQTQIDDKCYRNSAKECSWYKDCLQKRYGCLTSQHNGALRFQEKFCHLHDKMRDSLSVQANEWFGEVKNCLLDKLSPMIRPWRKENCSDIDTIALESLKTCYLKPNLNMDLSICQLDCKNWWLIFREIKRFFNASENHIRNNRLVNSYLKFGMKDCDYSFFKRCWTDQTSEQSLINFRKNFLIYKISFEATFRHTQMEDFYFQSAVKIKEWLGQLIDMAKFDLYEKWDETSVDSFILYVANDFFLEKSDILPPDSYELDIVNSRIKNVRLPSKIFKLNRTEVSLVAIKQCADALCETFVDQDSIQTTRITQTTTYSNAGSIFSQIKANPFLNIILLCLISLKVYFTILS